MKKVIVLILVILALSIISEARPIQVSKSILSQKKFVAGAAVMQSSIGKPQTAVNRGYYDRTVTTHYLYQGTCKSDIGTITLSVHGRSCTQPRTDAQNQWTCSGQGAKCVGTSCPEKYCTVQRNQIGVFV